MPRIKVSCFCLLAFYSFFFRASCEPIASEDIIFYLSFDDRTVMADMSCGEPRTVNKYGSLNFAEGREGYSLICGKGGGKLFFEIKNNIDFDRPGTVLFWFFPEKDWIRKDGGTHCEFFGTEGGMKGYFGFQLESFPKDRPPQERECKVLAMYFPDMADSSVNMATPNSAAEKWHLAAAAWSVDTIYISIDGKPFASKKLSAFMKQALFKEQVLALGSISGAPYRLDDFTIYRRKLDNIEILEIWNKNRKGK